MSWPDDFMESNVLHSFLTCSKFKYSSSCLQYDNAVFDCSSQKVSETMAIVYLTPKSVISIKRYLQKWV